MDIAGYLVENGASLDTADPYSGEQIIHIAAYARFDDFLKLIISQGADVNARDKGGETPLHYAAVTANLTAARILVEHGADLHVENRSGKTPAEIAEERGFDDIVDYLRSQEED